MKKVVLTVALALAMAGLASPALAHVEITPAEVPAGKPVKLTLGVGHGCGEAPTTSLVVQLPPGAKDVTVPDLAGWKGKVTGNSVKWSGGSLPSAEQLGFALRATLYGKKGSELDFKTIQRCPGGLETAWIQKSSDGEEPANPTPTVALTSTAQAPVDQAEADQIAEVGAEETGNPTATDATSEESEDSGSDGKTLLLLIVAGLAIGTIAGLVVRTRRKS